MLHRHGGAFRTADWSKKDAVAWRLICINDPVVTEQAPAPIEPEEEPRAAGRHTPEGLRR